MALLVECTAETSGAVPGVKGFCIGLSLRAGGVSHGHFDKHSAPVTEAIILNLFPQVSLNKVGKKTKEFNLLCKDTVHMKL